MLSIKKIFTFILLITISSGISAQTIQTIQTYNIDSLKQVLSTDLHDTNRIWALNNLGRNIQNSDTILALAEQAIALSQPIGFTRGEAEAYNNIGLWFNQKGNYPKALQNYLKSIQLSESINYEAGLKRSFNSISTVYLYLKDYNTSALYARKARSLSIKQHDLHVLALSSAWLSKAYLELHRNDSALKYAQESYEAAIKRKEPFPLYLATARLGEVNAVEGNHSLALEYLRLSLTIVKRIKGFFGLPVHINNWQTNSKILAPGTLAYFMHDKHSIFQRPRTCRLHC